MNDILSIAFNSRLHIENDWCIYRILRDTTPKILISLHMNNIQVVNMEDLLSAMMGFGCVLLLEYVKEFCSPSNSLMIDGQQSNFHFKEYKSHFDNELGD